jgi:hypothetical protein
MTSRAPPGRAGDKCLTATLEQRVVLGDKVNGALIEIVLCHRMMRHSVIYAALFCAFQLSAHATTLLPSQEERDSVTVKTCRDHEVLSSLKAAIDTSLQTSSVLARGMHAGDVHLEAVWIDRSAVTCSTTVAAKGIRDSLANVVQWFCSEEDALAKGFRKAKNCPAAGR